MDQDSVIIAQLVTRRAECGNAELGFELDEGAYRGGSSSPCRWSKFVRLVNGDEMYGHVRSSDAASQLLAVHSLRRTPRKGRVAAV